MHSTVLVLHIKGFVCGSQKLFLEI
jgi:hypothetical protein